MSGKGARVESRHCAGTISTHMPPPLPGVRFACLASLLGEERESRACLLCIILFYNHINSLYQKVVVQGICSLSWVPLSPLPSPRFLFLILLSLLRRKVLGNRGCVFNVVYDIAAHLFDAVDLPQDIYCTPAPQNTPPMHFFVLFLYSVQSIQ